MIFRKMAIISILVLALIGAIPASLALNHPSIKAGHPGTLGVGITEAEFRDVGKCAQGTPKTQGVDGWVIDLQGHANLNLTTTSNLPHSIVILFLSQGCVRVGELYGSFGTTSYSGRIPTLNNAPAKWAVVNGVYGANISINYTVS